MSIVSLEFSAEVKSLLKEIFSGEDFPQFLEGHTDDYLWYLVQHIARKRDPEFRKEMRRLAIDAHNAIHYSIQLG